MRDDEAWRLEELFWTGGANRYRSKLDPNCVMAFPDPVGVMTGEAIIQSLQDAPRWSSVIMREQVIRHAGDDIIILGYHAEGRRDGGGSYRAYCTSTYRFDERGWKLVQHQQTPIA
jgi:Domain of unknown function (DUF4440)